jgi:hypothetical protein
MAQSDKQSISMVGGNAGEQPEAYCRHSTLAVRRRVGWALSGAKWHVEAIGCRQARACSGCAKISSLGAQIIREKAIPKFNQCSGANKYRVRMRGGISIKRHARSLVVGKPVQGERRGSA